MTVNAPAARRASSHLETIMSLTLLAAVLSLLAWVVLVFFTSVNAGAIHLFLAAGSTLLVRWWALRA